MLTNVVLKDMWGGRSALWMIAIALSVEHAGEPLSRYEVEYRPGSAGAAGELRSVRFLELFETAHPLAQLKLFGLQEVLGDGWLKALKLDGYAPRQFRHPEALQQVLFPYTEAI